MLLHHGPTHGYTLIDRLGEFGLEGLHPSAVYRGLRDMDEKGWVSSSWDVDRTQGPPRRVYRITASGHNVLGAYMQDLRQTHTQIGHLMESYSQHMEEGEGDHH